MGKVDAYRRKHRTQCRDQQRCAITHQAMAQAVDGTDRCRTAYREQRHRSGLGHAPPQPQHQGRDRKDTATGARQAEHQPHHYTKQTCQQHTEFSVDPGHTCQPLAALEHTVPVEPR
ncbi:hypothetical protein D3C73_1311860 [compost metagenome]